MSMLLALYTSSSASWFIV